MAIDSNSPNSLKLLDPVPKLGGGMTEMGDYLKASRLAPSMTNREMSS